ncbi:CYFA0S38e00122g1_1 [Cyberlindnera fabianii]|uniref:Kinetochore protein SPC25 n=1 Tax=Cyberlindnera fabianii TaxID=36022 RepID=A0A061BL62_CYBFA|nr:CYFA0S38e00122g1_1 [Cyberlindnera fabianii]
MSDVQTFDPEVEERLEKVTEKFNQFIARQKTEIIKAKENYTAKVKQLRNENRDLVKQLKDSALREQELQSQLEREINDANSSESRLSELRLKEKQLADERVSLEKQVSELKDKVEERRKELSKLKENQQRQGELDLPETMVYEQLLGFRIDGIQQDRLRLVFINIDPQDTKKEYSLDLDVSEHFYKILDVSPSLPQQDVDNALTQLNGSRDLTHFLKTIRTLFKGL